MLDHRATRILQAANDALPRLPEMLGADAAAMESELRAAIERVETSWHAEGLREILRRHAATKTFLEQRVPETAVPRPFEGAGKLRGG